MNRHRTILVAVTVLMGIIAACDSSPTGPGRRWGRGFGSVPWGSPSFADVLPVAVGDTSCGDLVAYIFSSHFDSAEATFKLPDNTVRTRCGAIEFNESSPSYGHVVLLYDLQDSNQWQIWERILRSAQFGTQTSDTMGPRYYRTSAADTTVTYQAPASSEYQVVAFVHHRSSQSATLLTGEVNAKAQIWSPLNAPDSLTVTPTGGGSQAQLVWHNHHANRDTDSTEIWRTSGSISEYYWGLVWRVGKTATTYTDTPPNAGTWHYLVRHVTAEVHVPDDDASDLPRPNSPSTAAVDVAIGPPAPQGLVCPGRFTAYIDCRWFSAVSTDSTQVWRRKLSTSSTLVKTLAPGVQAWTDSSVQLDTTYVYQIRHREAGFDGAWSVPDTTVAAPIPPESLSCGGPEGEGTIDCAWVTTEHDTVEVYREGWHTAWQLIATLLPDVNGFEDTGLVEGKSYTYGVRYRNGTNHYTAFSNLASATAGAGEPYGPIGP